MKIAFVVGCVIACAMAATLPKEMMCSIRAEGYCVESTYYDTPFWTKVNMTRVNGYSHIVMYIERGTAAAMLVRPDVGIMGQTFMYMSGRCIEVGLPLSLDLYTKDLGVKDGKQGFGLETDFGSASIFFDATTNELVGEYFHFPIAEVGKEVTLTITYNVTVDTNFTLETVDDTFVMPASQCENATTSPKDALSSKCKKSPSPVPSTSTSGSFFALPSCIALILALLCIILF